MRVVFSQHVLFSRLAAMTLVVILLALSVVFDWQHVVSSGERVVGLDSNMVPAETGSSTADSGQGGGSYYMSPAAATASDRPTVFFLFLRKSARVNIACHPGMLKIWYKKVMRARLIS